MDTRSAANSVVKAVCRGDKRDMTMNPLAILIVILGFVIFSVYYMVIVHDIESYAALPFFFSLAVLILVLIACFTPLFIVYLLLVRNRRHSKREKELRTAMIDYLEASGIGTEQLEEMRKADEEIKNAEVPPSPKKILHLAVIGVIISIICWIAPVIHEHLGEVSYILIVAFLLLGMAAFPSITEMPYEHEKRFIEFYGIASAAFRGIGIELDEFPVTVKEISYDKMRFYSMVTLGAYSVYWAYVCLSSMNKHFAVHRRMEFTLISSLKGTVDQSS
ncbi:MAG: hypothetical protein FWF40_00390 [Methanomassiliicoccaceae archaeon]|nr:hypothetical protein [Methanomassiliicoccaceae archaeon]